MLNVPEWSRLASFSIHVYLKSLLGPDKGVTIRTTDPSSFHNHDSVTVIKIYEAEKRKGCCWKIGITINPCLWRSRLTFYRRGSQKSRQRLWGSDWEKKFWAGCLFLPDNTWGKEWQKDVREVQDCLLNLWICVWVFQEEEAIKRRQVNKHDNKDEVYLTY
jgi:hypothetical protein